MKFFARVRKNSPIDKIWRAAHRVSGELLHVKFKLRGQEFISTELTADEIGNLRHHPSVDLEAMSIAPSMEAIAEAKIENILSPPASIKRPASTITSKPTEKPAKK